MRPTAVRHFHSTQPQPWLVPVGLTCAGMFIGTRYIMRVQERVRRRRAGLLEDKDDDKSDKHASSLNKMQQILGVDVGSSNLRIATASLRDFAVSARVIESADGLRATPAAVAVDNDSTSVGAIAKSLQEREKLIKKLPYKVHQRGDIFELELDGKTYSPEWAAEMMLDYLHTTAVTSLGDDPMENLSAVLAVPAGTNEHERVEYDQVANSAGFNVIATIDEPVAALHAVQRCVMEELHSPEILSTRGPIAVLDIGGYVSTVSLLEKERHGIGFSLLHTKSTVAVSGHLVNELLFRSVVGKFKEDHGIDLSVDYMASYRILEAVESAKIELSSRLSSGINLPFITADRKGAKHLVHTITAFGLSHVQESLARDAITLCDHALYDAGVSKQDLSGFVFIGGGAKSKFMRQQLEAYFKRPAFKTKSFNPEEAVVLGASEYGRQLIQEC
ncbi:unnamed protein product [Peronospora effusa]|nr:unnamed protein product [Peronospora effusa]